MIETRKRVVILGAAGRDFHDFNVVYRDDPSAEVIAFTATQIPGIEGRRYPAALAGPLYPDGIPIIAEDDLERFCRDRAPDAPDTVVFAYSDVPHAHVMHLASRALALGADFRILGPARTMLRSARPVIAVSAVRTGCGKSQTARWIAARLRATGLRIAALRHPMPYGDLAGQSVQRFATVADLAAADCTIEEREEYEPHIAAGGVVFAGVDYAEILAAAEREADVILWDGGNNDFPFVRPNLHIVLVDALRPDQTDTHHPGEATLRLADVVVVNKVDAAKPAAVDAAVDAVRRVNQRATIVRAASPVRLDDPDSVRGRRALVVEDGPTITHGGMSYGAGHVAAVAAGAGEIVDPRTAADPAIAAVYERYPHIGSVLPAMGYGAEQLSALEATIERASADVVVSASPVDLAALIATSKPIVRARYAYQDTESPGLGGLIDVFVAGISGTDQGER